MMGKLTGKSASEKLSDALARIDRPSVFCTAGSMAAVLPGLEVEGVGPIGLPLTEKQANELKTRCEPAPFGKGTETLVDTKVRCVWRMNPEQFALANPAWTTLLHETVARVQEEFGLKRQPLKVFDD